MTIPPGLPQDSALTQVHAGGEGDWVKYSKTKIYTNCFIKQDGKLLLGYKKRGFGKDMYNGFGGKVEPGESVSEAAHRELKEEAGIEAPLRKCGTLLFVVDGVEEAFHIEVFVADEYTGTITESDEMRPEWFSTNPNGDGVLKPIPYDKMWADDIYWLYILLANGKFAGRADFLAEENTMVKYWFGKEETP